VRGVCDAKHVVDPLRVKHGRDWHGGLVLSHGIGSRLPQNPL
jgi:hypothetical protein